MASCILVASCNISWSFSFSLMKKSLIFLWQCFSFTFSPWWIVALISTMVVLSPSNSFYSLDAPLFTCFWNSILTSSIHFLLSSSFPIVQILCNTQYMWIQYNPCVTNGTFAFFMMIHHLPFKIPKIHSTHIQIKLLIKFQWTLYASNPSTHPLNVQHT